MKKVVTLIAAAAFAAALAGSASALPPSGQAGAPAIPPPPIPVKVVKVDPSSNTITVREIAAPPAAPGQPSDVTLSVPATATGKKLASIKEGDEVSLTCEVKPNVNTPAGTPIMINDCSKVTKIEDKPKD